MGRKKRIGIMGGTFNPVHIAHLILAENAYHQYDLDQIMVLPNGDPPHKTNQELLPAEDRVRMLELAIADIPYFYISDMEIKREGPSYSSVTLQELNAAYPDTEYYFIMGADSVFQIETWHDPDIVMSECIILAAVRDNASKEELQVQIDYLKEKYGADVRMLDIPDMELSSSEIRRRIRIHQPIRFMVPDAVREYIESHKLYQM